MRAASPTAWSSASNSRKSIRSNRLSRFAKHRVCSSVRPILDGRDMNARLAPPLQLKDLGALLAYATGSHARAVAFLVLISLVAFLPGFFNIPPTDRDEARFAQATKQMIESGDYVDIRFQNEARHKK